MGISTFLNKMSFVKKIYNELKILNDFWFEYRRFRKYSGALNPRRNKGTYRALITFKTHAIEKGLSLKNPRPGFGQRVINELIQDVGKYYGKWGYDQYAYHAILAILSYQKYHDELNYKLEIDLSNIVKLIKDYQLDQIIENDSSTILVQNTMVDKTQNFFDILTNRHSVRAFSDKRVEKSIIELAVELALKTPSVCNRQGWFVHIFTKKGEIDKVLSYQNGNRGFTDQIHTLILITGDLRAYFSKEAFQVYIDGGLFAMNLINALYFYGVKTCALNTSYSKADAINLRNGCHLQESQVPIMMIAAGYAPKLYKRAKSQRKDINEILIYHD